MKKLISCVASTLMVLGMTCAASASDVAAPNPYVPNALVASVDGAAPRTGYDEAERTLGSGKRWTSYQYYCDENDYFGGYSKYNKPSGDLDITIYYASSVGGKRTYVDSATLSGGYNDGYSIEVTKAGYYNIVIENNESYSITTLCGAMRDRF